MLNIQRKIALTDTVDFVNTIVTKVCNEISVELVYRSLVRIDIDAEVTLPLRKVLSNLE